MAPVYFLTVYSHLIPPPQPLLLLLPITASVIPQLPETSQPVIKFTPLIWKWMFELPVLKSGLLAWVVRDKVGHTLLSKVRISHACSGESNSLKRIPCDQTEGRKREGGGEEKRGRERKWKIYMHSFTSFFLKFVFCIVLYV